jgi:hypothetical protein
VGRELHIFDWTGVSPAGAFQVTTPLSPQFSWDTSEIYSTGYVTLLGPAPPLGDLNGDGQFNNLDIDPFAAILVSGSAAAVPEPAGFLLFVAGALASLAGFRRLRNPSHL